MQGGRNYFHTPECVYGQLVSEYPVMWLRDSTRIGACYTLRELLSPEGMVLAIQNAPPVTGWRLRMRYNEATDEEIDPQRGTVSSCPPGRTPCWPLSRSVVARRQYERRDFSFTEPYRRVLALWEA
jgi:hypothetical protein